MQTITVPSKAELTVGILDFLEHYKPYISEGMKNPPTRGLIEREENGVRANLTTFWWTTPTDGPFLTLSILKFLDIPLLNRDEVVAWIKQKQRRDGSFHELGLHGFYHSTYSACTMLWLLDATGEEGGWNRSMLVNWLQSKLQGKTAKCYFYSLGALYALGEAVAHPEKVVRYYLKKRHPTIDSQHSVEGVFEVARALPMLGLPYTHLRPDFVPTVQSWQLADGGFSEFNPPPGSFFDATAQAALALHLLGSVPLDASGCLQSLMASWRPTARVFDGYDRRVPRATHLGLLALVALGALPPPPHFRDLVLLSEFHKLII